MSGWVHVGNGTGLPVINKAGEDWWLKNVANRPYRNPAVTWCEWADCKCVRPSVGRYCGGITPKTDIGDGVYPAYPAWVVIWTYHKPITVPDERYPLLKEQVLRWKHVKATKNMSPKKKRPWEVAVWYCKIGLEPQIELIQKDAWIVSVYKITKRRSNGRKRKRVKQEVYLYCGG